MPIVTLLVLLGLACLLTLAAVFLLRRTRGAAPPPVVETPPEVDHDREIRREAAQRQGTELLERRVELDGRRGPLAGDASIDAAFDRLEERLRAGEISEDEFEAEKIRLLGG